MKPNEDEMLDVILTQMRAVLDRAKETLITAQIEMSEPGTYDRNKVNDLIDAVIELLGEVSTAIARLTAK